MSSAKLYYWGGVGSAFLIGVFTGVAGVRLELEKKMRAEYEEREKMLQGAYAKALDLQRQDRTEGPIIDGVNLDENLDRAIEGLEKVLEHTDSKIPEGLLAEGGEVESQNPYHTAVEAVATPIEMFVDGGINDYGISYIDEEDYLDEGDGRYKGKIDILMDGEHPIFVMDGEQINDWDTRVGDSILVDFFKLVPPGIEPQILYVRNHRTEEDYEVVRVVP